jgi:hypothetical protein
VVQDLNPLHTRTSRALFSPIVTHVSINIKPCVLCSWDHLRTRHAQSCRPCYLSVQKIPTWFQCCNESTTFNIVLMRKCMLVPIKIILHTSKYLMFFCCQSHVWKILDFIKMNLSCLKIPRKRKEKLKISGPFHQGVFTPPPACVPTQHANIPFHK